MTDETDGQKLLEIYLRDHFAGSTAGIELAKRLVQFNRDTEFGGALAEVCSEIDEDRAALRSVMDSLGVRPDPIKPALAYVLEKAGRIKLNGRLAGYSPLSRLLEIEGLITGVSGKLSLWRCLRDIAPSEPRLDAADLERLAGRAESQLDRLHGLREPAATAAFTPAAQQGTGQAAPAG